MTDPIAAGAQAILAALVPPVYFVRIDLLGALSSVSLDLSVRHGSSDAGAFVFTLHAVLVRAKYNQAEESLAYGKAAIAFFEKNGGSPLACPTYKVYSSHVAVWAMPVRDVLPTFHQAVSFGMQFCPTSLWLRLTLHELQVSSTATPNMSASAAANFARTACWPCVSHPYWTRCVAGGLCFAPHCAGFVNLGDRQQHRAICCTRPQVPQRTELDLCAVSQTPAMVRPALTFALLLTADIGVIQQAIYCLLGRSQEPCELDGEAFSLDDYHTCSEKGCTTILWLLRSSVIESI